MSAPVDHDNHENDSETSLPASGLMLILQTVRRKINRSLDQRGVGGTLLRALTVPSRYLNDRLRRVTPSGRRVEREERAYDRVHGVNTYQDDDLGWMARIESPNWKFGAAYQPAPVEIVTDVLAKLDIPYEEFTFIDFGSGKGRPLLLAAHFPFKRIIGVEYSPDLHVTALANIRAYDDPDQRCWNIDAVCEDATEFVIPPEPGVYFFHHPFDEPVFRKVVRRIEESLVRLPRRVLVVYYDPRCMELFERSRFFTRRDVEMDGGEGRARGRYGRQRLAIYEATAPGGS